MRRHVISQTGVGSSDWLMVDWWKEHISVGLAVAPNGNTCTVEFTLDDVLAGPATTIIPHPTLAGVGADAYGVIDSPVCYVRLTVTGGIDESVLTVLQSGGGPT